MILMSKVISSFNRHLQGSVPAGSRLSRSAKTAQCDMELRFGADRERCRNCTGNKSVRSLCWRHTDNIPSQRESGGVWREFCARFSFAAKISCTAQENCQHVTETETYDWSFYRTRTCIKIRHKMREICTQHLCGSFCSVCHEHNTQQ